MDIAVAGPARHERGNWTQTAARATAMPIHGADAIGPLPVTVPVPSLPVLSLLSVHPGALRPRGEAVRVTGWRRPAGPVSCQAVAWPGRRGDHGSIRAAGARRMDEKGRRGVMAATVLVAEDEQRLRELVRSYLELAGSAVLSTGSGAEAITIAADASPDLVVPDLNLPDVPVRRWPASCGPRRRRRRS